MGILIAIFIVFTPIFIWAYWYSNKEIKLNFEETEKRRKDQNVEYEKTVELVAGHPYLGEGSLTYFQIRKNGNVCFESRWESNNYEIHPSQIKTCEVKTEKEIKNDVTLGRFLMFGVFSLLAKKQTVTNDKYLLITFEDNGLEINCVFKSWMDDPTFNDILSNINRLRIESRNKSITV